MFHAINKGLKAVADFYRVAPFGETIFLLGSGFAAQEIICDNPKELYVMPLAYSLLGAILTATQFGIKSHLEKRLQQHGFEERDFEWTVPAWCNRQTARVVTEKYECLDKYVALCEKNKPRQKWRDLRHF
jgi:hypothetical protein